MGVQTRIGVGSLLEVGNEGGSIELPEKITFFCPQCGTLAADKGQCLLELIKITGESKTGVIVKLVVDCRSCACRNREPGVDLWILAKRELGRFFNRPVFVISFKERLVSIG